MRGSSMSSSLQRREFLEVVSSGIAAASIAAVPSTVPAANEKIIVGLIGCGNRGRHDAGLVKKMPNVELAYVCDVDETRRGKAAEELGVAANRAVGDLRRILDDKAVDAVVIATPD